MFDYVTKHTRLYGRIGSAFVNMHLLRLRNHGLPTPDIDANGREVRRLLVAACYKENEPPDEETGNTLTQWKTERKITATVFGRQKSGHRVCSQILVSD